MSSNSVCDHTCDKQTGLLLRDFEYYSYDDRPNWTTLSAITITNCAMHLVPYTITYTEPTDVKVRWETCAPAQSSHWKNCMDREREF